MTKKFIKKIKEDAPANNVGGGEIAGLGVGSDGEPGVNPKKKKGPIMGRHIWRRKNPNG